MSRTNPKCMIQQALRRIRIADHRRPAGAENACLLGADAFTRIAEIVHMIEVDVGDHGTVRIEHIDGIQSPAESDFKNHGVQFVLAEDVPGGECAELEIGQRRIAASRIDRSAERRCRLLVTRRSAVDSHALVVAQQVGRGIEADAVTGA